MSVPRDAVHARRLDEDDDDDDGGEDHGRLRRGDAEEEDRRSQRLDGEDADHGAGDRELAAHERRAAEHDREDRVELDVEARRVGVGGHDVRAVEDAGHAREQAARDVGAEDDAARAHAGEAARLGVDADGLGEHAERGSPLDQRDHDDRGDRDEQREGKPDDVAGRDELVRRAGDGRDEALGDEQRHAAAGEHQHERRDDGLDAEHRDEEAVPDAEDERDEEADEQRERRRCRGRRDHPRRR